MFSGALESSTLQRLGAAQPVSHTVLESLLFVAQLRREQTLLLSNSARDSLQWQSLDERSRQLQREEEEVGERVFAHAV